MIEIKKELQKSARNSIRLSIGGSVENKIGCTRFGGSPDVPEDFIWARYEGEGFTDNKVRPRPLSFLAQFDLEEISKYDTDDLLPKSGVLSFFYELDSQKWGFDPKDKGCARVYWFEDKTKLHTAEFPDDLDEDFRLPEFNITAKTELSYQDYGDFLLQREKLIEDWDAFDEAEEVLGIEQPDECSKLLGWANIIQNNMTKQCELVRRGYYLGGTLEEAGITPRDDQEAEQWANRDWLLLFQLDSILDDNYELSLGDGGRLYFYIRREELAARNFDNVWLVLQCS